MSEAIRGLYALVAAQTLEFVKGQMREFFTC